MLRVAVSEPSGGSAGQRPAPPVPVRDSDLQVSGPQPRCHTPGWEALGHAPSCSRDTARPRPTPMSHPTSLECEPNCDIRDVEPLDVGETSPEEGPPAAALPLGAGPGGFGVCGAASGGLCFCPVRRLS